jgi:N6-L-threonylcarbamoyladenine synthase
MLVLGIESSCDETGVALVDIHETSSDGLSVERATKWPRLLAQALHSQIDLHIPYGGVVPELASRDHIQRVVPLVHATLAQADKTLSQLDAIAFTKGPGLAGALLVGAGVACSLAAALDKPLMGVHHLEGHLLSPFLSATPPQFPFVALLVSGGHTQLMSVKAVGEYELLGESIDDAAGEAFDKSAKLLGIDYPGGKALSELAVAGDPKRYNFPRPLIHSKDLNFSFAGLKTAVSTQCKKLGDQLQAEKVHIAASTQQAIVEVLQKKAISALEQTGMRTLVVAGGVGANKALRLALNAGCKRMGVQVFYPELEFCTDNGAMIAMAAAMRIQTGRELPQKNYSFEVNPRWPLDQR